MREFILESISMKRMRAFLMMALAVRKSDGGGSITHQPITTTMLEALA
jgi:hypothetical protein